MEKPLEISSATWNAYGEELKKLTNVQAVAILAHARMVLAGYDSIDGFADTINRWTDAIQTDKNAIIRDYLESQLKTVTDHE